MSSKLQASDLLVKELQAMIGDTASETISQYGIELEQAKSELKTVLKETRQALKTGLTINIKVPGKRAIKLNGLKHESLETLITMVASDLPVLMVGSAGTGKTHGAEQVAYALNIPFYALSVGAQTSKSDIIGYMSANGTYVGTLFRKAYEHGGVFLMDEIDAGNSNVLIQINSALSNCYCAFPDGMVKKHKDFRFIATANTFGLGASRMYVGRNQLDAATLDRFTVIEWNIDNKLEDMIVGDSGANWIKVVRAIRDHVNEQGIRALVTPRASIRGNALLQAGIPFDDVLQMTVLNGIPTDNHSNIISIARDNWTPIKELHDVGSTVDLGGIK